MLAQTLHFDLPAERIASEPAEARGLRRDDVRLLVARPDTMAHTRFAQLPSQLRRGDLVVVNTSPTMPAAVDAIYRGRDVVVHLSTLGDDGLWTVEIRRPDNTGPVLDAGPGDIVELEGGQLRLVASADGGRVGEIRLWRAGVRLRGGVRRYLRRNGRPIRYGYVPQPWPLDVYQTIFADPGRWPGSAEMASAARPFTRELVRSLRTAGVGVATIELHAGVSSQESLEPPQPEPFVVPAATAKAVNRVRHRGGRVVAVGTTVTRALESVAAVDGSVTAAGGWTDLVLGRDRSAYVVDGLITGWHPAEASHLDLLRAVAGQDLVAAAYETALAAGYLWHEFGDSCLLLPQKISS